MNEVKEQRHRTVDERLARLRERVAQLKMHDRHNPLLPIILGLLDLLDDEL